MISAAIELDGVDVRRGRRQVLSVKRLSVGRAELLAIVGPNGAGKSTLLKCLIGMTRIAQGRVVVLGQPIHELSSVRLTILRRRIAYLAQILAVAGEMPLTVREVVSIGRTGRAGLLRRLRIDDWRIVDSWIDRLGLSRLASRPYGELSGGEQRKTLLAMAMVQQPEILLLDEPTANLDVYWREQIVSALEELRTLGSLTIVLVCHDLEAIPSSTDRVAILQQGHLIAEGDPRSVLVPEQIEALYGSSLTVLHQADRFLLAPRPARGSS